MKKHILLPALFLSFSTVIAACGSDAGTNSANEQAPAIQEGAAEEENKKDAASYPVKLNETVTLDEVIYSDDGLKGFKAKLKLTVTEVTRGQEAYEQLQQVNKSNKPAPEGFEWVLVKVKGKLAEAETEEFPYWLSAMNFKFVSEDGDIYNQEASAAVPNELDAELFKGMEEEGYFADLIEIGDEVTLKYETLDARVFFQTQ
ncbi:hypothetical protein [Bacillus thermotolerans]|uniref:DUF4352 domain-containing protein n=1 Tax=Bacillus thermotolerans TaxID=1221996 RepID=A0A0F5HLZ9_BACTR|nr:hypothetical protein [Bacillus thermotolerans]KKB33810.1 hypothetical protein QY96_00392 [Bacillus thermotolerans]KKB34419.1 hypothetical protein QY97_02492 [Bacillus thermotolerans]KKB38163.1 hypothetical protein QY95_02618 [Bacillus thermotolerans]